MARLIDANKLPDGKFVKPRTEWHQGWNDALDAAMSQAPTVDAVEVVRCKDCRFVQQWKSGLWCDCNEHYVQPDDYCSEGERKAE